MACAIIHLIVAVVQVSIGGSMKKTKVRRNVIIVSVFLAIYLIVLVIAYFLCRQRASSFENKIRSTAEEYDYCTFTLVPRGSKTDSWSRILSSGAKVTGIIYSGTFSSYSEYPVSDWYARLDIGSDCYISDAWNGEIEFHQFGSGEEVVQSIYFKDYSLEDIKLDYIRQGNDLMIELHKGDYVIYRPSREVYEVPVQATMTVSSVNIGIIFYYESDLIFDDCYALFHLECSDISAAQKVGLSAALGVWFFLTAVAVILLFYSQYMKRKLKQQERIIESTLATFTKFVDAKDPYTNGHSERVGLYTMLIAQKMGLSETQCKHFRYVGLMHDCGKCYIPDGILKKPGRLTEEEYDVIKTHTTKGAKLLEFFDSIEGIRDGALYHHERYDGKGYPEGKAGADIPLIARIICVADAFDAMNSQRYYRNRLDREKIRSELVVNKGKQFDPEIVDIFLEMWDGNDLYEEMIKFNEQLDG